MKNEEKLHINEKFDIFERLLETYNITFKDKTFYGTARDSLIKISEFRIPNGKIYNNEIVLPISPRRIRLATALNNLIDKIFCVDGHPDFPKLIEFLKLIDQTNFAQNDNTLDLEDLLRQHSNKLFELHVALALLRIGTDLEIEYATTLNNPDLIFTIDDLRFGVACKVLNMEVLNEDNFFNNVLSDGIDQINRSNVDKGLVIINFKNLINHDSLLKCEKIKNMYKYKIYDSFDLANSALTELISQNWNSLKDRILGNGNTQESIENYLFPIGNKSLKCWINYYSTVSLCFVKNHVANVSLLRLNPQFLSYEDSLECHNLIMKINDSFYLNKKV